MVSHKKIQDLENYGTWVKTGPAHPQKNDAGTLDPIKEEEILGEDLFITEEEEELFQELEETDLPETLLPRDDENFVNTLEKKTDSSETQELLLEIEQQINMMRHEIKGLKEKISKPHHLPAPQNNAEKKTTRGFFEEEDNETVALTGDELDNILDSTETIAEEMTGLKSSEPLDEVIEDWAIDDIEPLDFTDSEEEILIDESPEEKEINLDDIEPLDFTDSEEEILIDESSEEKEINLDDIEPLDFTDSEEEILIDESPEEKEINLDDIEPLDFTDSEEEILIDESPEEKEINLDDIEPLDFIDSEEEILIDENPEEKEINLDDIEPLDFTDSEEEILIDESPEEKEINLDDIEPLDFTDSEEEILIDESPEDKEINLDDIEPLDFTDSEEEILIDENPEEKEINLDDIEPLDFTDSEEEILIDESPEDKEINLDDIEPLDFTDSEEEILIDESPEDKEINLDDIEPLDFTDSEEEILIDESPEEKEINLDDIEPLDFTDSEEEILIDESPEDKEINLDDIEPLDFTDSEEEILIDESPEEKEINLDDIEPLDFTDSEEEILIDESPEDKEINLDDIEPLDFTDSEEEILIDESPEDKEINLDDIEPLDFTDSEEEILIDESPEDKEINLDDIEPLDFTDSEEELMIDEKSEEELFDEGEEVVLAENNSPPIFLEKTGGENSEEMEAVALEDFDLDNEKENPAKVADSFTKQETTEFDEVSLEDFLSDEGNEEIEEENRDVSISSENLSQERSPDQDQLIEGLKDPLNSNLEKESTFYDRKELTTEESDFLEELGEKKTPRKENSKAKANKIEEEIAAGKKEEKQADSIHDTRGKPVSSGADTDGSNPAIPVKASEISEVLPEEEINLESLVTSPEISEIPEEKKNLAPDDLRPSSENFQLGILPESLKEEIKEVLLYMDELLESLPDEKIQEFARSEHFEVYKKIFEELEISS